MREFNLDDIVDVLHEELGFKGPKKQMRQILRHHLNYVLKVMKSKRHRILMRETDIHTIYMNPNLKELCGKIADLDETKIPQFENGFAIKDKKFRDPYKSQKKAAWKAAKAVDALPKLIG